MKMNSPNWNEKDGVCTKHGLPEVPCPQCIADADADIEFVWEDTDQMALDFGDINGPEDLMPKGFSTETHTVFSACSL